MPAFTLTQLRDKVRRLGDYENVTEKISNAFLTECINTALGQLYDLVSDQYQGYYDKIASLVTVAGTQTVALPSDFYTLRRLERDHGSNTFSEIRRINLIQSGRFDGSGEPTAYSLFGGTAPGTIRLWPIPDAVYTLRITYEPLFTALSADGDSFDFRNGWELFVVYEALILVDVREERPTGEHQAQADKHRARIMGSAAKRDSAEPEYLMPRSRYDEEVDW